MPQIWLSILLLLTAYFTHFVTKYVASYMQEKKQSWFVGEFCIRSTNCAVINVLFDFLNHLFDTELISLTITFLQNLLQML